MQLCTYAPANSRVCPPKSGIPSFDTPTCNPDPSIGFVLNNIVNTANIVFRPEHKFDSKMALDSILENAKIKYFLWEEGGGGGGGGSMPPDHPSNLCLQYRCRA